jgi:hypothetical protein
MNHASVVLQLADGPTLHLLTVHNDTNKGHVICRADMMLLSSIWKKRILYFRNSTW